MAAPIYVFNDDAQYFVIKYNDAGDAAKRAAMEARWKRFDRPDPSTGQTHKILYRPTSLTLEAQVDHLMPAASPAGRYRIETFVPGKHATTRRALFTVAHNFRLENGQPAYNDDIALVNMYDLYDAWYSLGEYDLDPARDAWSGRVRQFDLSIEEPALEVAFGPVRWVPVQTGGGSGGGSGAGGTAIFDSPVGTQTEREGPFLPNTPAWVGKWFDYNPFLSWYAFGYHTGADLNLSTGPDADKNAPLYAIGDGTVIYAGKAGTWGQIIVIEHPDALVTLPNGKSQRQRVYSRYGHVSPEILVKKGEQVPRGKHIGYIGLAEGAKTGWHLHFDIGYTDRMKTVPSTWPNMTKVRELQAAGRTNTREYRDAQSAVMAEVVGNYLDPLKFLKQNHG